MGETKSFKKNTYAEASMHDAAIVQEVKSVVHLHGYADHFALAKRPQALGDPLLDDIAQRAISGSLKHTKLQREGGRRQQQVRSRDNGKSLTAPLTNNIYTYNCLIKKKQGGL